MDFKRGTNRASRIITERSTWPSVEHNRESRAFLVRAHLVFSSFSLSYFAIVLGVCWSDFLQRFESYEDRFRAVVIVRLAIFSELPFLSQFFFSPLLLEVLWGFLFCSSFALKWYECAFFLSNAHCLSHSFVLASPLLMTIWDSDSYNNVYRMPICFEETRIYGRDSLCFCCCLFNALCIFLLSL
jgi:hypothetical protein